MMRGIGYIIALLLLSSAGATTSLNQAASTSPAAADDVRFAAVEVYLDPRGTPLAAYQLQIVASTNDVTLVGIEGGEHPAFSQPPYYDKRAMLERRLILASYSLAANLPGNKTRVATLMVRINGKQEPKWNAELMVAGSVEGKSIDAAVSIAQAGAGGKTDER